MTIRSFVVDGIAYTAPLASQVAGVSAIRFLFEVFNPHACPENSGLCTFDKSAKYVDRGALERKLPSVFLPGDAYGWAPGDPVARFGGAR